MDYPTLDELRQLRERELAAGGDGRRPLVPICRDMLADMETPVSAYCKTARGPYSFLLESVAGGEQIARYSFIGIDPYLVMIQRGEKATLRYSENGGTAGGQGDHIARGQGDHKGAPLPYTVHAAPEAVYGRGGSCAHPGTPTRPRPDNARLGDDYPDNARLGDDYPGNACHDPLAFIEAELGQYRLVPLTGAAVDALPRFHGGAVGYLAYEAAARFERLPVPEQDELELPLAIFCFTETVLVFDHLKHRVRAVAHLHLDAPDLEAEHRRVLGVLEDVQRRLRQAPCLPQEPAPIAAQAALQLTSNTTQAAFEEKVRRAQEYIRAGDIFQVVLSQRLSRHVNAAPFTVYRALRAINPSPYMFYLDLRDMHIIGASPELLVRVEEREVTIHPIAGTRPRGSEVSSDRRLADELLNDPKERAEHVMLVDLGRNDVGRVSQPGSVQVSQFMEIERYSHVMHLVSNVTGQLREDVTPYDALRAGFPAGTVSGAPKLRAMEIISELEHEQRGVYAGAVGYFSHTGNLDTAIALRTMVMKDGRAYIQAGGGIVADSNANAEYQESMNKARALLRALDEAEIMALDGQTTSEATSRPNCRGGSCARPGTPTPTRALDEAEILAQQEVTHAFID